MQVTSTVEDLLAASSQQTKTDKKQNSFLGKEDFLLLLITQMKHQNPLDPIKNEEFASQLAQFSSLEQLTNLNEITEQSLNSNMNMTQSITNSMAANLVGKRVLADNSTLVHLEGEEDMFRYHLGKSAKNVNVRIVTQTGNVLFEREVGAQPSGYHVFTWDGIDKNGNLVSDGQYRIEVVAEGLDGEELDPVIQTSGVITSVRYREGVAYLVVNNAEIPLSEVREITAGTY